MHAPLARHLARFDRNTPAITVAEVPALETVPDDEPTVTITVAALEGRLDAARDSLRASLEAEHRAERERSAAVHAEAMAMVVTDAAARRDAEEGAAVAAQVAAAVQTLSDSLAEQIAKAVRPLLADAVAARTIAALVDAVTRVLADPDHPSMTVRGSAGRLAAMKAVLGDVGVTYEVIDGDEIHVSANRIRIETRIAAALAALAATEGS